jgi:hypothetical protein
LRIRVNIEVNARSSGWIHLRTGKHCPEIPAIQLSDSPENRVIGDYEAILEQKQEKLYWSFHSGLAISIWACRERSTKDNPAKNDENRLLNVSVARWADGTQQQGGSHEFRESAKMTGETGSRRVR